jgi:hypothetical protein
MIMRPEIMRPEGMRREIITINSDDEDGWENDDDDDIQETRVQTRHSSDEDDEVQIVSTQERAPQQPAPVPPSDRTQNNPQMPPPGGRNISALLWGYNQFATLAVLAGRPANHWGRVEEPSQPPDNTRMPILTTEEYVLRQALLRSLQDSGPDRKQLSVDRLSANRVPQKTRSHFTRSLNPSMPPVCADCKVDLGVGLSEETKQKHGLITEGDRLLSKRVFFIKCGHVFCGRCVSRMMNRRRKRGQGALVCPVEDCKRTLSKPKKDFFEVFY